MQRSRSHIANLLRLLLVLLVLLARAASAAVAASPCCDESHTRGTAGECREDMCDREPCADHRADQHEGALRDMHGDEADDAIPGAHAPSKDSRGSLPCAQGCLCCASFTLEAATPLSGAGAARPVNYALAADSRVARPISDSIDHPPSDLSATI